MTELNNILMWQNKLNNKKDKKNFKINNNFKIKSINNLVRQAARWAIAAEQDKSPIVALLHANYAAGYLWALRDIATDADILDITKIDIINFSKKITNVQDKCTKKVSNACPNFVGDLNKYFLKISQNIN